MLNENKLSFSIDYQAMGGFDSKLSNDVCYIWIKSVFNRTLFAEMIKSSRPDFVSVTDSAIFDELTPTSKFSSLYTYEKDSLKRPLHPYRVFVSTSNEMLLRIRYPDSRRRREKVLFATVRIWSIDRDDFMEFREAKFGVSGKRTSRLLEN